MKGIVSDGVLYVYDGDNNLIATYDENDAPIPHCDYMEVDIAFSYEDNADSYYLIFIAYDGVSHQVHRVV